jgi:predicted nucleic acid-binding Zn ribbon protein
MPVYEWECDTCGVISEEFYRSIPKEIPTHLTKPCKPCGDIWSERSHKRVLSKSTFTLKGMGWATDRYDKNAQPRVVELDEPSVI